MQLPSFSGEKNIGLIQEVQDAGVGDWDSDGNRRKGPAAVQCPRDVRPRPPPPRGRAGGEEGTAGRVSLVSGKKLRVKGEQTIPRGDRLKLELPGGGGFGNPYTVNRNESRKISRMV